MKSLVAIATALVFSFVTPLFFSHSAALANEAANPFTAKFCETPNYSDDMLRKNSEGTVKLSYEIDLAGRPQNIQITISSGDHALDVASISALKKCVFPSNASAKLIAFNWKIQ